MHGLHLSLGALVDATRRVAAKAQTELAGIVERIRGSPVVHADETGWQPIDPAKLVIPTKKGIRRLLPP